MKMKSLRSAVEQELRLMVAGDLNRTMQFFGTGPSRRGFRPPEFWLLTPEFCSSPDVRSLDPLNPYFTLGH